MISIYCGDNYRSERNYIIDVLLHDFLGLEYKILYEPRLDVCIERDGKKIIIDDSFFQQSEDIYLKKESLPVQPLKKWYVRDETLAGALTEKSLPVIYGRETSKGEFLVTRQDDICIGIDIFGSAFFMLTRYEETVLPRYDKNDYDHYIAEYSLAYQEGFLERPIINEYLELLWWGIARLWPEFKRIKRNYRLIPTHDVDLPSVLLGFIRRPHWRRFVGDIVYRRDLSAFLLRCKIGVDIWRYGFRGEWKYTFDYIMDISEGQGVKSTFFFMTPTGLSENDGIYTIDHPDIISLIKHICERGHSIGIHPSFASFRNPGIIKDNVNRLREVLDKLGLEVNFGGRQHYLRWEAVTTWQEYEDAGLEYDMSLSFADHIGFRCGVCYDFPCFNLKKRKQLKLREYPLIIMDASALNYMGLTEAVAIKRGLELKRICQKYNGNFVMLWHNDKFIESKARESYEAIIRG